VLSKTKNNIIYLGLLLLSMRLVGCASVTEDSEVINSTEQAPIVDLNAPKVMPKAPPQTDLKPSLADTALTSEDNEEISPLIALQEQLEPVPITDAWQRLRQGFEITPDNLPYSANKQLQRYLKNPHNLNLLFEYSAPYLFHVTEQLENANLPLELALLPIVESNYDPLAYSPSHAVGLWQPLV
jgi:membrane-bound lytic murein transglycosylase D